MSAAHETATPMPRNSATLLASEDLPVCLLPGPTKLSGEVREVLQALAPGQGPLTKEGPKGPARPGTPQQELREGRLPLPHLVS